MKKTIILTIMFALITMTGQAQSKIGTLAETMWRNEQTGDWGRAAQLSDEGPEAL